VTQEETRKIIEALLFASDRPLNIEMIREALDNAQDADIQAAISALNAEYADTGRSFSIKEIAGGFQFMTDPIYSRWIARLSKRAVDKLTGPALETLAIIAYRQPITRGEIEAIRGVNVDGVLHTLESRSLIRTRGRKDTVGRPILYGTTTDFLEYFGLKSLQELPQLKEFTESELEFVKETLKKEEAATSAAVPLENSAPAAQESPNAQDVPGGQKPDQTPST